MAISESMVNFLTKDLANACWRDEGKFQQILKNSQVLVLQEAEYRDILWGGSLAVDQKNKMQRISSSSSRWKLLSSAGHCWGWISLMALILGEVLIWKGNCFNLRHEEGCKGFSRFGYRIMRWKCSWLVFSSLGEVWIT